MDYEITIRLNFNNIERAATDDDGDEAENQYEFMVQLKTSKNEIKFISFCATRELRFTIDRCCVCVRHPSEKEKKKKNSFIVAVELQANNNEQWTGHMAEERMQFQTDIERDNDRPHNR